MGSVHHAHIIKSRAICNLKKTSGNIINNNLRLITYK